MVAEIRVELVDAVTESFNQGRIACVKFGLIEAEYEWAIIGCELTEALSRWKLRSLISCSGRIALALVVGRIEPKQHDLFGFERLGTKPFQSSAAFVAIARFERTGSKNLQPRLLASDEDRYGAGASARKRPILSESAISLTELFDPSACLRLGEIGFAV